ncbi:MULTISPECIES: hypothetical protein [unclassified Microcoleus]|uniref:hypothetical protein n=1 Tax=unclassified Microcoleus TaxID=2642155 RepID=UPI002FD55FAC
MGQFDYLRDQISNNIWIDKEILQISEAVTTALNEGREWYFSLPHIQFIAANPVMGGVKDLLTASQDLGETVVDCNLVFLETVYGINKAFNSKVHKDLAGKAQTELAKLAANSTEKAIYEASVMAHNESLNLPELSVKVAAIEAEIAAIQQQGATAAEQIERWKNGATAKLEELKNELLTLIEGLQGNPRRNARARLRIVEAGIEAMQTGNIPTIIALNPYEITSQFDLSINSTFRRAPVVNNAIVPIAAGGAATVAGAATVLTGIAGWLLSSFFLKAASIPATLLPALTNTVVSIVLKVMGSAGADAARYLAASALKAGQSLLPKLFGATGMQASGWAYLMAWATPIIGAAAIIIQAMRNKLSLADMLYTFAELRDVPGKFNLTQAHVIDTNRVEILEEFKTCAKDLLSEARLPIERIIGVGIDRKKEYAVCYILSDPDSPVQVSGKEAIAAALGADKIARIASGKFGFFDLE